MCKTKFADLLSIGAAKNGGRWNALGKAMQFAKGITILRYASIEDAMSPQAREQQQELADRIAALIVPSAINPVFNVVLYPDSPFEIATLESIQPHEFHPALNRR